MNYYSRHIGDYARDTGHLSMLEDGAYQRLLDRYYATERPIPEADINRITRATTQAEKRAVLSVLAEFFKYDATAKAYRHSRVERVIQEALESEDEAKDRKENERERQKRHRERRKTLFAALREYGEVPPFETANNELETLLSRVRERDRTRDVTVDATAIHQPLPNSQYPIPREGERAREAAFLIDANWQPDGALLKTRLFMGGREGDWTPANVQAYVANERKKGVAKTDSAWNEGFVLWMLREPSFNRAGKKPSAEIIRDNAADAAKLIRGAA